MRHYQLRERFYNKGLFESQDSNLNAIQKEQYNELLLPYLEYLQCDNKDFSYRNNDYKYPIEERADGIYSGKFRLDPIFYSWKDIPCKIFMTFNFKGVYAHKGSHQKRVEFLENLILKARKLCGNLSFNDIHPVFTEETKNGKRHIHVLLFIKDNVKINLKKLVEALYYSLDNSIVYIPRVRKIDKNIDKKKGEKRTNKIIEIPDIPLSSCAYSTKLQIGELNKPYYIRDKNTERYKKNGSFQVA